MWPSSPARRTFTCRCGQRTSIPVIKHTSQLVFWPLGTNLFVIQFDRLQKWWINGFLKQKIIFFSKILFFFRPTRPVRSVARGLPEGIFGVALAVRAAGMGEQKKNRANARRGIEPTVKLSRKRWCLTNWAIRKRFKLIKAQNRKN